MSTNSESDERSSSSSNNMLFNFDFDSQPLPTRIPLQVFIGSMKQFQNRPKHLEHSYYILNNEVNVNADFINSKEFDAFNLHFTGEFQQFNFKNLISIKQQAKQITLNKCTVALNCQTIRAGKIDFQDCFVTGEAQELLCYNLTVQTTGQDIKWIKEQYASTIYLRLYQFNSAQLQQLEVIGKYTNIKNITIDQSEIDLKVFCISLNQLEFRHCTLINSATYLKINELCFYESQFRTSQLMNACVNHLKIINDSDWSINSMYGFYAHLETIIDDLPNTNKLTIDTCIFKLKSYCAPHADELLLNIRHPERICFNFFVNFKSIVFQENEPQMYQKWKELVVQDKLVKDKLKQLLDKNVQIFEKHREIIKFAKQKLEKMEVQFSNGRE
ncbi:Hypothetical_protein [Hexamita inflata]|uniref:Hypothetical_protein n=2 Tax=Hexamita inflata TaxID=28002 RepID=A0AA86V149_9EUKA|nr:Hypothetical protein HINF_LOCUS59971 [Hexamita inflata]